MFGFMNVRTAWTEWIERLERYRSISGLDEKSPRKQVDTNDICKNQDDFDTDNSDTGFFFNSVVSNVLGFSESK